MSKTGLALNFTLDKALGAVGGGLAVASLGFGVYMNIHGPVAGLGTSHDFTVFAQLAPKHQQAPRPQLGPKVDPAIPSDNSLDMTATASIPKPSASAAAAPVGDRFDAETAVIPSVTLEAASPDAATIAIDGHPQIVRIGDTVPGAGEVLEIRPGRRAVVKTSRGLILAAQQ